MRVTLEALSVLDSIDKHGSFAAAATALHRVPSAVTYTVQKLEQDLSINIFDRSSHRARLTPAGRLLLERGRYLLQAAEDLECHAQRVAEGWESVIRIAVGELVTLPTLFPLLSAFYAEQRGTDVRLMAEVLAGGWDALIDRRADLVIGAAGEAVDHTRYQTHVLGTVPFVFVVAPTHPLAQVAGPLSSEQIAAHRVIAVADSARTLPAKSYGLLPGQQVLTVPDMATKIAAQLHGLGVGYVPRPWVAEALASGDLLEKSVAESPLSAKLYLAWRDELLGKALGWFIQHLKQLPLADLVKPL